MNRPNYTGRAMRALLVCNQVMMRHAPAHPRYRSASHRFDRITDALNKRNAPPYFETFKRES